MAPAKTKPGTNKHADPNAASSSSTGAKKASTEQEIAGITPIEIPEKFISPCYFQPAPAAPADDPSNNVFGAWQGQVPKDFPDASDHSFFGGGGATRTFDVTAIADDNDADDSPEAALQRQQNRQQLVMKLNFPDHRTERELRLEIPANIISRDTTSDDVAIRRLDNIPLDTIKIDEFYSLLLETSFIKRESMLKKDAQRGRGDVETFLDGEPVENSCQYRAMLDRLFITLSAQQTTNSKGLSVPEIRTEPSGRRTIWLNFKEVCEALKRTNEEVRAFICNKLTTTSKYDGEGQLHVDITRLTPVKLQKLVVEYAVSHVKCQSCLGWDTKLVRDVATRLDNVTCNVCGAKRSVDSSSGGYVAIANRRARVRARALN